MTTKNSPLRVLKAHADKIAATIKAAERGDKLSAKLEEKVAEARARGIFNVGIVMDDKVLRIDIPWDIIRDTTEAALSEYIVNQMREATDAVH